MMMVFITNVLFSINTFYDNNDKTTQSIGRPVMMPLSVI